MEILADQVLVLLIVIVEHHVSIASLSDFHGYIFQRGSS